MGPDEVGQEGEMDGQLGVVVLAELSEEVDGFVLGFPVVGSSLFQHGLDEQLQVLCLSFSQRLKVLEADVGDAELGLISGSLGAGLGLDFLGLSAFHLNSSA